MYCLKHLSLEISWTGCTLNVYFKAQLCAYFTALVGTVTCYCTNMIIVKVKKKNKGICHLENNLRHR